MSAAEQDITAEPASPGLWGAWWAVAAFSARQTLWSRRAVWALLLLVGPPAIGVVVRSVGAASDPGDMADFYWGVTLQMMLTTVVPLTMMFYCSTLILDEVSVGTIVYLFTRRLSRPAVLMAKFAGTAVPLVAAICLSEFVLFAVSAAGDSGITAGEGAVALFGAWALMTLAALSFGAIFAVLGVLVRRPLVAGVGYLVLCEWIFASTPIGLRKLSLGYHLRCVLKGAVDESQAAGVLKSLLRRADTPPGKCLFTVVAVIVVCLIGSCLVVSCKEFTRAREEQK